MFVDARVRTTYEAEIHTRTALLLCSSGVTRAVHKSALFVIQSQHTSHGLLYYSSTTWQIFSKQSTTEIPHGRRQAANYKEPVVGERRTNAFCGYHVLVQQA